MLNLRETISKTEKQLKAIEQSMDAKGCYHPEDASLYEGLNQADTYEVMQTLKSMTLAELLAKSGTTGIQGAAYLVAAKVHDELIFKSQLTDIVPLISAHMATAWQGGDLSVNIVDDQSFKPTEFSSGGLLPTSTINVMQPTSPLAPKSFGVVVPITEDMIEDNQYDLMQYHIDKSAMTMGTYASDLALTVLKTATDGWGTVNGGASGNTDETRWSGATTFGIDDVVMAKSLIALITNDGWAPNTLVITPEAWIHSVKLTPLTLASNIPNPYSIPAPAQGFDAKIGIPPLDMKFSTSPVLHLATDVEGAVMTKCVTIVFDRNNAMLTGRKRWLEIKNYADPIRDLSKAIITARQDSVTLYDDAIGVITET